MPEPSASVVAYPSRCFRTWEVMLRFPRWWCLLSKVTRCKSVMQACGTVPPSGGNAAYVEELYELYLHDPNAVPEEWRTTSRSCSPVAALQPCIVPTIRDHSSC